MTHASKLPYCRESLQLTLHCVIHANLTIVRHQKTALDFMHRRERGDPHDTLSLWRYDDDHEDQPL